MDSISITRHISPSISIIKESSNILHYRVMTVFLNIVTNKLKGPIRGSATLYISSETLCSTLLVCLSPNHVYLSIYLSIHPSISPIHPSIFLSEGVSFVLAVLIRQKVVYLVFVDLIVDVIITCFNLFYTL